MILQSLNRYYQILLEDPEADISPPGFNRVRADFALILSDEGKLLGLAPLVREEQRGNKTVLIKRNLIVPKWFSRTSNIVPNFLCDKAVYILGIPKKDKDFSYSLDRFFAFKKFNISLLENVDSPSANALKAFLKKHNPEKFIQTQLFLENEKELQQANLVFKMFETDGFVHDETEIKNIWLSNALSQSDNPTGQCLVTGETTSIALIHDSVKGIPEADGQGAKLVSFQKNTAYESFDKTGKQGLNAPVSTKAMFAYTTALKYLLSESSNQKFCIGETVVVFWAESLKKAYTDLFTVALNPTRETKISETNTQRNMRSEALMKSITRKLRTGQPIDQSALFENLDSETRFFVLGLSANKTRVIVRFYYNNPFRKAIENLVSHHEDMALINEYGEDRFYPIWRIIGETVSRKAREGKPAPLLAGAVFRSVLMNLPYPAALYNAILIRIRADKDDRENRIEKINHLRAAVIKAYLTRKYRHQKKYQEELQMGLNKESTNQAYLLGRLFAVLEKAQQDAAGKELNATIKDRYFTSACASPATTFPILLRLSQHYISKAEYGYVSDRRIQDIMQLLEVEETPFPKHLNLDEQGIFVLGYYHQRADFYQKKTNSDTEQAEEN